MENVWDRFETIVTPDEIKDAAENTFEKLEEGDHVVTLLAAEPAETQGGAPIVKFKFKVDKTKRLFSHSMFLTNMNYPERTANEIVKVINFLRDLTGKEYSFTSMSELARYILNIEVGNSYEINAHYRTPETKYPEIRILERKGIMYEVIEENLSSEDLPF